MEDVMGWNTHSKDSPVAECEEFPHVKYSQGLHLPTHTTHLQYSTVQYVNIDPPTLTPSYQHLC